MILPRSPLSRRALLLGAALGCVFAMPAVQACAGGVARIDLYDRSDERVLDIHHHGGRQYVVGRQRSPSGPPRSATTIDRTGRYERLTGRHWTWPGPAANLPP